MADVEELASLQRKILAVASKKVKKTAYWFIQLVQFQKRKILEMCVGLWITLILNLWIFRTFTGKS